MKVVVNSREVITPWDPQSSLLSCLFLDVSIPRQPESCRSSQQDFADNWQAREIPGATAAQAGLLHPKTRQLVMLSMEAAQDLESTVPSHTQRALAKVVTPYELEHQGLLGATTMGFPQMMAALNWVMSAAAAHQG